MEFEIGIGKTARRAYGFDEVAIVPSRRTRDPEDVNISWEIDAYTFELPMMASAMDAAVSPTTAIQIGQLGGLACLNLEGLWTRYEDPDRSTRRSTRPSRREGDPADAGALRRAGQARVDRQADRGDQGGRGRRCTSLTPARVEQYAPLVLEAGLDILVIQGTVVSAEHVSSRAEPLNLKEFIPSFDIPVIVGGCASYSTALHLMRTGAVGVLVGVGPGNACTTRGVLGVGVPQATAIADAAAARREHLHETGRYCHVIADGGMRTGGDIAKAIACGADAVMIGSPMTRAYEAPGRGYHWGMATFHPTLPRGARVKTQQVASIEEILVGPAHENDGTFNLFGALATSMATTGYETIKEFQKAELVIAPVDQDRRQDATRPSSAWGWATDVGATAARSSWSTWGRSTPS